jgi:hypothetical protein
VEKNWFLFASETDEAGKGVHVDASDEAFGNGFTIENLTVPLKLSCPVDEVDCRGQRGH